MRNELRVGFIVLACLFMFLAVSYAQTIRPTVFDQKGNIYLKVADKVTPLTTTGRDSQPALSPDGRWVAFSREIEGKVEECSERDDLWACPSDQLWIMDLETQSERLLLEPRTDVPPKRTKDIIYKFEEKKFSPDSQTIYFITPAWVTSAAIHAVDIDGNNERYVMHGYSFQVVREPLSPEIKKYLAENLKKDDWRIFPERMGVSLIEKALEDDVIGYLIIRRGGVKVISSATPLEDGWKGDDGKYYASDGRKFWTELISPDGKVKIPLDEKIW